jgi:hypothetical protein
MVCSSGEMTIAWPADGVNTSPSIVTGLRDSQSRIELVLSRPVIWRRSICDTVAQLAGSPDSFAIAHRAFT